MRIDIGGTPSKVLEVDSIQQATGLGHSMDNLIAVVDPFNYARYERTFPFFIKVKDGQKEVRKILFEAKPFEGYAKSAESNLVDISSEFVGSPDVNQVAESFDRAKPQVVGWIAGKYKGTDMKALDQRYDGLKDVICRLTGNCPNFREYMDSILEYMIAPVKVVKLEEVQSQNTDIVYKLLEKFGKIPVRAVCPVSGIFEKMNFSISEPSKTAGGASQDEIIRSGKYIAESGFFPAILYLAGVSVFISKGEYSQSALDLLNKFGVENPQFTYSPADAPIRTYFERYVLGER